MELTNTTKIITKSGTFPKNQEQASGIKENIQNASTLDQLHSDCPVRKVTRLSSKKLEKIFKKLEKTTYDDKDIESYCSDLLSRKTYVETYKQKLIALAAKKDCVKILKFVLERDIQKAKKHFFYSPDLLNRFVALNAHKCVAYLVNQLCIDVNALDNHERTALHIAAEHSCIESLQALLKRMGVNIDQQDSWGQTPLHVAASNGCHEGIKILLESHTNTSIADDNNQTPLDILQNLTKNAEVLSCIQLLETHKQKTIQELMGIKFSL